MGDPYWRYPGAGGRPSSSEIGHVPQATFPGYLSSEPQATFPGYLSSETSTLANYNAYSSVDPRTASSDFLHKDIISSRSGAYGIDDIPSVRAEPDITGLVAGASYRGYPSSYEDPNVSVRQRDVASGINAVNPDVGYDKPSSITRTDGNTVPAAESNILFIDGLPTDCTRREIGHLFRPFIGFREIRLVHKEPRRRGDKAMVLCFVEFTDAKCAVTAMEALQGFIFISPSFQFSPPTHPTFLDNLPVAAYQHKIGFRSHVHL
ncbi:RNA-binding protein 2-like isoform X2 [Salvia miltiorrhiza]|uniref:RNA-binding protein 2-like isoform X2 n=1 Tax=Salvia miltiorrhiza TaxID=226208 RepID=UPI0025ABDD06|nr:RNA-binding protein 2-like isoform X2 [Salvia miltiorrhiza]